MAFDFDIVISIPVSRSEGREGRAVEDAETGREPRVSKRQDEGSDMNQIFERPRMYDAMINWEARRKREMPFFQRVIPAGGRVLDVACGTGHHAIWLAQAGFRVEACDLSEDMLSLARQNASEAGVDIDFFAADMTALPPHRGLYDGIVCVGNALSILDAPDALRAFFERAERLLAPGGRLLFQVLNDGHLLAEPRRFEPVRRGAVEGREVLFLKMFDFTHGAHAGRVELAVMWRDGDGWKSEVNSTRMTAWSTSELVATAEPLHVTWFGDHAGNAFDPTASIDRIGVATRNEAFHLG